MACFHRVSALLMTALVDGCGSQGSVSKIQQRHTQNGTCTPPFDVQCPQQRPRTQEQDWELICANCSRMQHGRHLFDIKGMLASLFTWSRSELPSDCRKSIRRKPLRQSLTSSAKRMRQWRSERPTKTWTWIPPLCHHRTTYSRQQRVCFLKKLRMFAPWLSCRK
jgi:hypothetical protein